MIIECLVDPNELIGELGNASFMLEDPDESKFADRFRIFDREGNIYIDIYCEQLYEPRKAVESLVILLNQNYKVIHAPKDLMPVVYKCFVHGCYLGPSEDCQHCIDDRKVK